MMPPCKDCTKRHPNCHSSCSDYHKWRKINYKVKKEIQVERDFGRSSWFDNYGRRKYNGEKGLKKYS